MKCIEIMIATLGNRHLSVRWLHPLANGVANTLHETLEDIDGVERVTMCRYSATVEIADHVATVSEVAEAIVEELEDPERDFQYAMRFEYVNSTIQVVNVGKVEVLK